MSEIVVDATIANIETITAFVDNKLEALGCPAKIQAQFDIATDEIVSNISLYAYSPATGKVTVRVEIVNEPLSVIISFMDDGVPFDPLQRADPDTGLPAESRDIGGLGIYLIKKSMDNVSYEYKDGKNILTISKAIASDGRVQPK